MLLIEPSNIFRGAPIDYNNKVRNCKQDYVIFSMFVKSVSRIIEDEIGISPTNSISTHKRKYVEARQIFTTLICKYSKKSLREVGDLIKRDHSTVIHSKMVVSNLYDTDINYRERYNRIEHRVKLLK